MTLPLNGNQASDAMQRMMSNCANMIVRLGGTILTNTHDSSWGSHELTFETARARGLLRLYPTEVPDSKLKIVAVMVESRK